MSAGEGGFALIVAEKFLGIILLIVGALATFFTYTSTQALQDYTGFFGFLSLTVLVVGLVLIIARAE